MTREYNNAFPSETRTVDSLKKKIASFHRKKMPTGDPLMPPEMRCAKQIRSLPSGRAKIGVAEDAEVTVSEAFDASADELNDTDGTSQLDLRPHDLCSLHRSSDTTCTASSSREHVLRVSRPHKEEQPVRRPGNATSSTPKIQPSHIALFVIVEQVQMTQAAAKTSCYSQKS